MRQISSHNWAKRFSGSTPPASAAQAAWAWACTCAAWWPKRMAENWYLKTPSQSCAAAYAYQADELVAI